MRIESYHLHRAAMKSGGVGPSQPPATPTGRAVFALDSTSENISELSAQEKLRALLDEKRLHVHEGFSEHDAEPTLGQYIDLRV